MTNKPRAAYRGWRVGDEAVYIHRNGAAVIGFIVSIVDGDLAWLNTFENGKVLMDGPVALWDLKTPEQYAARLLAQ